LAEKEKNKDKGKKSKKGGNGEDKELKEKMGKVDEKTSSRGVKDTIDEEAKRKEEEEMIKKLQEEIDKLTTKDIIIQMMMSLSSLAYKRMGLPVGVNDKYKDKMQAKMAVDCFDALLKVISDEIGAEERENLKSSLSNLQINFVKIFI
jgi:glutamate synthase domain-containing protein 1